MPDPVTRQEKGVWFKELCDLQESIAGRRTASMKGRVYRVLCESISDKGLLSGRTEGNVIIEFPGSEDKVGSFVNVKVTEPKTWVLFGEEVKS